MTWFANSIYAIPTKDILQILADDPVLSERIYWVRDLSDHKWPDPKRQHDMLSSGLLVVRPVGDPDGHYAFWYQSEQSVGSWSTLTETADMDLEILPSQVHQDNQDFNLTNYPPVPFLKWLKRLGNVTKTIIAYYHCTMWGGDVEIEYSWVFMPNEIAYSFVSYDGNTPRLIEYHPNKPRETRMGDVLVETMKHFGLNLPTPYFALHTRSFPWHQYKYESGNTEIEDTA